MAKTANIAGVASALVIGAGTVAALAGGAAWRRESSRAVDRLKTGIDRARAPSDLHAPLVDLPAPVQRYLDLAIPPDLTRIRSAHIRWRGEFQMRPNAGWHPFDAEQDFTARPPGFVWDARIMMIPFVPVHVRDVYVASNGAMLGKIAALVTMVNEGGTPEIAASALIRWLGEAVWFPTALVPDGSSPGGVQWESIDDSTARAIVTDGPTTVAAEFHFAPTGEIERMTAMRHRDVNGVGVLTPFEGRYHEFARRGGGVLIPRSAEVAWLLPEGRYPYWRGSLVEVAYETHR